MCVVEAETAGTEGTPRESIARSREHRGHGCDHCSRLASCDYVSGCLAGHLAFDYSFNPLSAHSYFLASEHSAQEVGPVGQRKQQDPGGIWIAPYARENKTIHRNARQLSKTAPISVRMAWGTNELFYVPRGSRELRRLSLHDGAHKPTGTEVPGSRFGFDVRSDGKEILYTDLYSKATFVVIDNLFK